MGNIPSSEAAAIGCLFALVIVAAGLWYYVFRYKHENDNDEDGVTIANSSPDGHTVVVKRNHMGRKRPQSQSGELSNLFFPEVANPLQMDVEMGSGGDSGGAYEGNDEEEETIQVIHIEGIVKMGYLRKKSTGHRWLRRCFFIKDGKLFYVHKHTELVGKQSVTARQVANLVISTAKEVTDVDFQIISPGLRSASAAGGIYELQGENPLDTKEWLKIIRMQIEGALNQTLPSDEGADSYSIGTPGIGGGQGPLTAATKFVPGRQTIAELRERNPYCADCGAADPEWASLNLCIMMCIDCSGIHRKLGTHVSKVRSITLDKWTYNSIQLILAVGNDRSNEVWEAQLGVGAVSSHGVDDVKPSAVSSMDERERFIVRKYADRDFVYGQEATADQKESYLVKCAVAGDLVGVMRAVAAGALRPIHEYTMRPRKTALHWAVTGNHPLCVELLCQMNQVMATLVDEDGLTPLGIAQREGFVDVEEILAAVMFVSR